MSEVRCSDLVGSDLPQEMSEEDVHHTALQSTRRVVACEFNALIVRNGLGVSQLRCGRVPSIEEGSTSK